MARTDEDPLPQKAQRPPWTRGTNVEPEFCTSIRAWAQGPRSLWFCETRGNESSPLLGGAEAEGFGVGAAHEDPTPALRDRRRCGEGISSLHPLRGRDFLGTQQLTRKIQVLHLSPFSKGIEALRKLRRVFCGRGSSLVLTKRPVVPETVKKLSWGDPDKSRLRIPSPKRTRSARST